MHDLQLDEKILAIFFFVYNNRRELSENSQEGMYKKISIKDI